MTPTGDYPVPRDFPTPKCDCWKYARTICDICQGVDREHPANDAGLSEQGAGDGNYTDTEMLEYLLAHHGALRTRKDVADAINAAKQDIAFAEECAQ